MARTRELVEKYLLKAQQSVQDYATAKGMQVKVKADKKKLLHDPQWRRLVAAVKKFQNQVKFIDKRNAKPVKTES